MSGGQQQRVSLARALIMNSEVLLFDEPLSNLDAKLRLHRERWNKKITKKSWNNFNLCNTWPSRLAALSDKIVIMKDGKIAQVGTPHEIYQTKFSFCC